MILNASLYVRPLHGVKKVSAMKKKRTSEFGQFGLLIVSKRTVFTDIKWGYKRYDVVKFSFLL